MDSKITTYYTMDSKGLHFYYKVRDALIFGGEGSVGYCTATVNATNSCILCCAVEKCCCITGCGFYTTRINFQRRL